MEICSEHGGAADTPDRRAQSAHAGPDRWRRWFLQAPYIRDRLALRGLIVETFESACTWSAFGGMHAGVLRDVQAAVESECGRGIVTRRLAYAYPDGAAPYYTVVAVGEPGREADQWAAIKRAASDAIEANGGTTTHHHAIGRTHLPWYQHERGSLFLEAIASAKHVLDPVGIMNPGVLLPRASGGSG